MDELKLPTECEECKSIYDLDDDLIGEDWNKTIANVLSEKYGHDKLLCPKCRKVIRMVEEGKFRMVYGEDRDNMEMRLELISENKERRVWKVRHLNPHQITFDILDDCIGAN